MSLLRAVDYKAASIVLFFVITVAASAYNTGVGDGIARVVVSFSLVARVLTQSIDDDYILFL